MFYKWVSRIRKFVLAKKLVNIYSITFFVFCLWLTFFDGNNLRTQWNLKMMIKELESEKVKFIGLYAKALQEKETLEQNQERFAREKYFMHKENEDIFIITKR
jgi:hypothetical protein